jgi:hypothetical protein
LSASVAARDPHLAHRNRHQLTGGANLKLL